MYVMILFFLKKYVLVQYQKRNISWFQECDNTDSREKDTKGSV